MQSCSCSQKPNSQKAVSWRAVRMKVASAGQHVMDAEPELPMVPFALLYVERLLVLPSLSVTANLLSDYLHPSLCMDHLYCESVFVRNQLVRAQQDHL